MKRLANKKTAYKYLSLKFSTSPAFTSYIFSATVWKVSKYKVISGPYFPVFGLNKEIYRVCLLSTKR